MQRDTRPGRSPESVADVLVKSSAAEWTIVGQGLAGTCLAWALHEHGHPFRISDNRSGGSSRMAAGMINPITGKNFEPSWKFATYLTEALDFYSRIETKIGRKLWHPMPILRLAVSDKEWRKIQSKLGRGEISKWVRGEVMAPSGWVGAVELQGGGRLDTASLLDGSNDFFKDRGHLLDSFSGVPSEQTVHCEGAAALMANFPTPHRCAKGEILTIRNDSWDESRIRIGAGGWLVPQGAGIFKVGSTYEWEILDEIPSMTGRTRVEEIASRLGGENFEVIDHVAAIRPILRRSQPLIGRMEDGSWMMNGLGSKGSLYAPGIATRLSAWLVDSIAPDPELDFGNFVRQFPSG